LNRDETPRNERDRGGLPMAAENTLKVKTGDGRVLSGGHVVA
jgi:hypothetical protein